MGKREKLSAENTEPAEQTEAAEGSPTVETPYTHNPLAGGEPGEPTGVRWSVPPESETVERVPVGQDAGAEDDEQAD
jgi:hypothetical protein